MAIFHSYVKLPEGSFHGYKLPHGISLSLKGMDCLESIGACQGGLVCSKQLMNHDPMELSYVMRVPVIVHLNGFPTDINQLRNGDSPISGNTPWLLNDVEGISWITA